MPELPDWVYREGRRIRNGIYQLPVWHAEPWYSRVAHTCSNHATARHFLHVSQSNPQLLAYTESDDKGERDIQTPIKPGRYLSKYFSDVLTEKQIAYYAAWQLTGKRESQYTSENNYPLAFASDPDDIVRVYRNGPDSCMGPRHFDDADHPCRIYGAGDLAIAYLHAADNEDNVVARALVWPEHKIFGRVYPTPGHLAENEEIYQALTDRLIAAGYKPTAAGASFNGARLLKIEHHNGDWLMPYLDGDYRVNDGGEYWIIDSRGEYQCAETNGVLRVKYYTCYRCGDVINEEDTYCVATSTYTRNGHVYAQGEENWCEHCANNHSFICEATDTTYGDDLMVEVKGSRYVYAYVELHFIRSDLSDDWIDPDDVVTMANGDKWSEEEFREHGFICRITGENYDNRDMHPDHENVWCDVDQSELDDWLASSAAPAEGD